uniref:SPHK1 interactor, AKAP domain containing n=1 Tax=Rousettus aegyptiacus TaxID=9407 RepID=A0A7J8JPB6_ROUAE|nr:SPHK1 interactor, AKAP domain containing [Rousettus aegyptiacus]
MDGTSLLSVPSISESPLMCEVSTLEQGGASGSSGSSLGSSVTACKKVLRSNSLLESTDYWLQNQRTPCQIGFVEDKSENTICASVSKPNSGCRLRKQGICRRRSAMDSSFLTG